MTNEKGGATLILLLVLSLGMAGYMVYKLNTEQDSAFEEFFESVAEREVENLLDLPDKSLDGTLDLTVKSKEK